MSISFVVDIWDRSFATPVMDPNPDMTLHVNQPQVYSCHLYIQIPNIPIT